MKGAFMETGQEVEIYVGEPWDVGIVKSRIVDEKDGILMFYTEQPITVGKIQVKQFYGKQRYVENTDNYNFAYIPGVEDYTIDDIKEYEKDWSNVKFFMIGGVKRN